MNASPQNPPHEAAASLPQQRLVLLRLHRKHLSISGENWWATVGVEGTDIAENYLRPRFDEEMVRAIVANIGDGRWWRLVPDARISAEGFLPTLLAAVAEMQAFGLDEWAPAAAPEGGP